MLQTALVLRSVQRGYVPDKSFVIVSFLATGVLLIGWRSALAIATKVALPCALSINALLISAMLVQGSLACYCCCWCTIQHCNAWVVWCGVPIVPCDTVCAHESARTLLLCHKHRPLKLKILVWYHCQIKFRPASCQVGDTGKYYGAQHVDVHHIALYCYPVMFLCNDMQNSGQQQGSQNRQGNPLEFLQLLASLTKRW